MTTHLRRLLAAGFALTSLVAFSATPLAHANGAPAHASRHHRHHHRHHSTIPQHNGGDHDADNNGGPSDGDGNI
jgi:Spy/CpxP family protein refolding chaperone